MKGRCMPGWPLANCHPDPGSDDLEIHPSDCEKDVSSGDDEDSSHDLMEATKAVFDTPVKPAPAIGAMSLGLGNPRERIIGSNFPECKDSSSGADTGSPLTSPDESIKRLFDSPGSSEETLGSPTASVTVVSPGRTDVSTGEDSPLFRIRSRKRHRSKVTDTASTSSGAEPVDYSKMVKLMPKGVLDAEALRLLRSSSQVDKSGEDTKDRTGAVRSSVIARASGLRLGQETIQKTNPPEPGKPTVRAMVEEAANQGAYLRASANRGHPLHLAL